jgi:hypothetical protein
MLKLPKVMLAVIAQLREQPYDLQLALRPMSWKNLRWDATRSFDAFVAM